tara:strand:- start:3050 stop:3703 length:654 start_codon:yes stop_codon:yes gene_type:complete
MALIPSIKQSQVSAGVTKCRAQAVKVYTSEAITEGDLLSVTGMSKGFMKVAKADANGVVTLNGSLLFVADYTVDSGEYTPVALPWRLLTGVNTAAAAAAGDPVYLSDTAGGWSLTAGTVGLKIGTVLVDAVLTGVVLLAPQAMATTGGGVFVSAEVTSSAGAQNTAHGLGYVPRRVLVTITDSNNDADHVITEGAHTSTNCVVTVAPASQKYKILAM